MKLIIGFVCLVLVSLAASDDTVVTRSNIDSLNASEIQQLRSVQRKFAEDSSIDGLNYLGSIHGFPRRCPTWKTPNRLCCEHGTLYFCPWHRYFIMLLESILRKYDKYMGSVYLDWTCLPKGLPKVIMDKTYIDPTTNKTMNNPLESSFIAYLNKSSTRDVDDSVFKPDENGRNELCNDLLNAFTLENFCNFSAALEQVHNKVHNAVGGSFAYLNSAGYDPMFAYHHTNTDRCWYHWQVTMLDKNLSDSYCGEDIKVKDQPMEPFNSTAHVNNTFITDNANAFRVFDLKKLPYKYDTLGFCCLTFEETKKAVAEKNTKDRVKAVVNARKVDAPAVAEVEACDPKNPSDCSHACSFHYLGSPYASGMPAFVTHSLDITDKISKFCDPKTINETGLLVKITEKDAEGNVLRPGTIVESLVIKLFGKLFATVADAVDNVGRLASKVLQAPCEASKSDGTLQCKNFVEVLTDIITKPLDIVTNLVGNLSGKQKKRKNSVKKP